MGNPTNVTRSEVSITPRVCATCRQTKIQELDFYKNSASPDGLNKNCINCVREYLKQRRKAYKQSGAKKLDKTKYASAVRQVASLLVQSGMKFENAAELAIQIVDDISKEYFPKENA